MKKCNTLPPDMREECISNIVDPDTAEESLDSIFTVQMEKEERARKTKTAKSKENGGGEKAQNCYCVALV